MCYSQLWKKIHTIFATYFNECRLESANDVTSKYWKKQLLPTNGVFCHALGIVGKPTMNKVH